MVRHEEAELRTGLGGGTGIGPAYVYELVPKEDLCGHGRMYAKIVLPKGSTIGWHQHVEETEPYYILSGTGEFVDNDKSVHTVTAGDICTIKPNEWHSLANIGDDDLVFIALVYYNRGRNE